MTVDVIQVPYTYKGKDGKDYKSYNYYLKLQNEKRIPINPVVIYKKDEKGNKTDEIVYDGKSDLSLIATLVEK